MPELNFRQISFDPKIMTAIFISVIGLALMVSAVLVIFNQSRFMPLLVVAVLLWEKLLYRFGLTSYTCQFLSGSFIVEKGFKSGPEQH